MSLQFQLEWEPRWRNLREEARILLRRDPAGALPSRTRTLTGRSLVLSGAAHVAAVLMLCFAPGLLDSVQVSVPPQVFNPHDYTIYYVPQHLPALADARGASEGTSGRAGGAHLFHPRQAIRIARGPSLSAAVVDAPRLRLKPAARDAANLLALLRSAPHQATFNPPPVTAIESGIHAPKLSPATRPLPELASLSAAAPTLVPAPILHTPKAISGDAAAAPPIKFAAKLEPPVDSPALPVPPPAPIELRPNQNHFRASAPPKLALGTRSGSVPIPSTATVLPMKPSLAATAANGKGDTGELAALVMGPAPGNDVGRPRGAAGETSVMSPHGGSDPGAGGSDGMTGAGPGNGAGVGAMGAGNGGGSHGSGAGSDNVEVGIGPIGGSGGAGNGASAGIVPGVSISGNVVDVPSFAGGDAGPARPHRGPADKGAAPAVVVVGTSRSGGGLAEYGVLRGGRVYTTYIDTPRGTVVLQYADPSATSDDFDLTPPQAIATGLPAQALSLRTVISCVLDRTGVVTNVRVLDAAAPPIADAVARSLHGWKFHPALRGDHAVTVQAILGFGVTTQ